MEIHEEIYRETKNLRTVGRCIYCGASGDGVKLTKEHMIPYSLGSNVYLKDASCLSCAKVTRALEQHVARSIFGHHRIHRNVQTRHPEQRPDELDARVLRGGSESKISLPIKDHPHFLGMPVWAPPQILRGLPPANDFEQLSVDLFWDIPPSLKDALGLADEEQVEIKPDIKADAAIFGRALAKIAYCHMIANPKLDEFDAGQIPNLILGKYPFVPYLVGSTMTPNMAPEHSDVIHGVGLADIRCGNVRRLIACIRLFVKEGTNEHGMPFYTVALAEHPDRA